MTLCSAERLCGKRLRSDDGYFQSLTDIAQALFCEVSHSRHIDPAKHERCLMHVGNARSLATVSQVTFFSGGRGKAVNAIPE